MTDLPAYRGFLLRNQMGSFHRATSMSVWGSILFAFLTLAFCQMLPAQQPVTQARAYLYIEPYQARFECLVSMDEMLTLLKEAKSSMFPASTQEKFRSATRELAANWLGIKIDGKPVSPKLISTSLVKGVPGRTERIGPDDLLVVADTMIGMVWEVPFATVPEKIDVTWHGFRETLTTLPVSVVIGAQSIDVGGKPETGKAGNRAALGGELTLTKEFPSRVWENRGSTSLRRGADIVPAIPSPEFITIPLGSIIWLIVGWFVFRKSRRRGRKIPGRAFTTWMSLVLGAAVLWRVGAIEVEAPSAPVRAVDAKQAERILTPLLRNTYRAFDQRDESAIYDTLARSIEGDLLQKVYLQTINALTLDAQDGTRVSVTDIGVDIDGVSSVKGAPGFIAHGGWTAMGSVGHWGHNHPRVNGYKAKITVQPVKGVWKITGLEILEERRA